MAHVVILVTTSSTDEANEIGRVLVEERLAACANVLSGVSSRYWWKGEIGSASEALLMLKTRQDLIDPVSARVRSLHSYTVPEVIALPIIGGSQDYLDWIDDSTRSN